MSFCESRVKTIDPILYKKRMTMFLWQQQLGRAEYQLIFSFSFFFVSIILFIIILEKTCLVFPPTDDVTLK